MSLWNCYILVVGLIEPCHVVYGNMSIILEPGVYFYIGSARGPGGALARIVRHLSRGKRVWWHIDKLLECPGISICGVFLMKTINCDCEFEVTRVFREKFNYIPRFGSSDKRKDLSHLFKCSNLVECLSQIYVLLEAVECLEEIVYAEY
ncbi:MAG: GIY-YIG nuclease family protein [Desulfurococcaceae archaeon]|jgi:Uri superfamily endonuclease|nr:GIY-YIG nuclease family protein [Desulfurococcaceae archaeon]